MKYSHFAITDVGKRRTNNEDSVLVNVDLGLYLVADGMGGHAAGEVASKLALKTIESFFLENPNITEKEINKRHSFPKDMVLPEKKLALSIMNANDAIKEAVSKKQELMGMGTTVATMHTALGLLFLAHVGDSRIYRFRRNRIMRMTEDHNLFEQELKKNIYSRSELEKLPHRDGLVRALGHMDKAKVDISIATPRKNDLFLICSDGLTNMVEEEQLLDILMSYLDNLEECGHLLVRMANENGGKDNITLILLRADG